MLTVQPEFPVDDYSEGVRKGIKDALRDEPGIYADYPESSPASLQDFNPA